MYEPLTAKLVIAHSHRKCLPHNKYNLLNECSRLDWYSPFIWWTHFCRVHFGSIAFVCKMMSKRAIVYRAIILSVLVLSIIFPRTAHSEVDKLWFTHRFFRVCPCHFTRCCFLCIRKKPIMLWCKLVISKQPLHILLCLVNSVLLSFVRNAWLREWAAFDLMCKIEWAAPDCTAWLSYLHSLLVPSCRNAKTYIQTTVPSNMLGNVVLDCYRVFCYLIWFGLDDSRNESCT